MKKRGYEVSSATRLRACYAMPGTDIAYAAMHCRVLTSHMLLCNSCTEFSQTAMRWPVLTWYILLRACYAMPGTESAYAATRTLSSA
eukprot:567475-Rhodomonas_salina.1